MFSRILRTWSSAVPTGTAGSRPVSCSNAAVPGNVPLRTRPDARDGVRKHASLIVPYGTISPLQSPRQAVSPGFSNAVTRARRVPGPTPFRRGQADIAADSCRTFRVFASPSGPSRRALHRHGGISLIAMPGFLRVVGLLEAESGTGESRGLPDAGEESENEMSEPGSV
jgi:hypothetical protein